MATGIAEAGVVPSASLGAMSAQWLRAASRGKVAYPLLAIVAIGYSGGGEACDCRDLATRDRDRFAGFVVFQGFEYIFIR
jgi:hypothetical protein